MSAVLREHVLADLRERISSIQGEGEGEGVRKAGALHEFAGGGSGTVDGSAAALFAAGIAARTKGPIVWCLTRPDLFFPALAQVGLKANRVVFVESDKEEDVAANMEEAISYGGCGAVIGEMVRQRLSDKPAASKDSQFQNNRIHKASASDCVCQH